MLRLTPNGARQRATFRFNAGAERTTDTTRCAQRACFVVDSLCEALLGAQLSDRCAVSISRCPIDRPQVARRALRVTAPTSRKQRPGRVP
ncbi:hypothetical protein MRX96_007094 [Rhipicephalus microplus]